MKTRDAVLAYQQYAGDTDTVTIDLNLVDPVSAIELEVGCTNGATSNVDNFISDIVTSIQVVDGAEVLASLNMAQLEALHFYKQYRPPYMFVSEAGGAVQRHNPTLFFGRMLYDTELCLVPTNYRNPQLKITFNKAAIRPAGATGFASGTNIVYKAVAKVIEEGATPTGFLMQKVIDSFTSVSSGDKRVDLPLDYPYRLILLRAWLQGSDVDDIIGRVKLTADSDKYVPLDGSVNQLLARAAGEYGAFYLKHVILRADSEDVRLIVNKEPNCSVTNITAGTPLFVGTSAQASGQLRVRVFSSGGNTQTTAVDLLVNEAGYAPHATVPIQFGVGNDPGTWFDPRPYGKLELVLTQATAGATVEVVTEQLKMY